MADRLEQDIDEVRRGLQQLRRHLAGPGREGSLDDLVDGLATTLEHLEVSFEEVELGNEELRATREELEAAERAYRELFELAPDPYLVSDVDGVVVEANRAAGRLLRVSPRSLHGRQLAAFLARGARAQFVERLSRLAEGGTARDWELHVRPRRGPVVVVAADVTPGLGGHGGVASLRWLLRDVTDVRRAQQALRRALTETSQDFEQLRDVDRWKDAFMAAAAHDLRTPLSVIRSGAETLGEDVERLAARPDGREVISGIARDIRVQAERLQRLLEDLLDLDRFTRGVVTAERTPTDVRALVDDVLSHLDVGGHPVDVDGHPVTVDVDAVRVAQIVQNLVSNAVAHTRPGTPIHVEVLGDEDSATIIVEDEGDGIPRDVAADVFLPFVSAASHEDDRAGTGIGLSLVQLFAELHGGGVRAEDRDGGGARLVVELPGG